MNEREKEISKYGEIGQGEYLVEAKFRKEKMPLQQNQLPTTVNICLYE